MRRALLAPLALSLVSTVVADEADVVDVEVSCAARSVCDFRVTVRHADEGWEHYADRMAARR